MAIDAKAVGERLKEIRKVRGKSLPALAEEAGIAKSYIFKLERGKVENPGLATLSAIARALKTTLAELLAVKPLHAKGRRPRKPEAMALNADTMPEGLKEFLAELEGDGERVPADIVRALAVMQFRGKRPETVEEWHFIYQAVKLTLGSRSRR